MRAGLPFKYWYDEEREALAKLLPNYDINLVIDILCATSMNSTLKANVTLFLKAMYQINNDLPLKGFMPNIKKGIEDCLAGGQLNGMKTGSFARALKGDKDAVVVDLWHQRCYGIDREEQQETRTIVRTPTPKEYRAVEAEVRNSARILQYEPRQVSAMIWGGMRKLYGNLHDTGTYSGMLKIQLQNNLFPLI